MTDKVSHSDLVANKLEEVAQQLQQVASMMKKPEIIADNKQTETKATTTVKKSLLKPEIKPAEPDIIENLSVEVSEIVHTAFQQLHGQRPEHLPDDQLYGWVDSLSLQLGNKPVAPTDEIRQLQELVRELQELRRS